MITAHEALNALRGLPADAPIVDAAYPDVETSETVETLTRRLQTCSPDDLLERLGGNCSAPQWDRARQVVLW